MVKNDDTQTPLHPLGPQFETELTDGDYSEYLLYSKTEILAVLRSVIQKGVRGTVHFDHGQSFFLTSIITLQPGNTEFITDVGGDEKMNDKALKADDLIFTAFVDKVKIQFGLKRLQRVVYQGNPAFTGAVPDKLLRLQRREFFRLSTPVANPVQLHTALGPDKRAVSFPLLDISGGGIGLMISVDLAGLLERGQILENCKITLPDDELLISASLCVRNMFDVTTRSGLRHIRVGCEYVGLSASKLSTVQRYIIHVERERKARLGLS